MTHLFAKKSMESLMSEAHEEGSHSLERTLGPVSLTMLGIGAVIGAGIFVLSGLGAKSAGPALMLAFVLSGLGCAFAGLCYAEFAAMIPLAGSAYTYAYATLGELFAWIIGWDLTLEYAMGASTVSSGWSNNFVEFLNIFGLHFPLWLSYDHWTGLRTSLERVSRASLAVTSPNLHPGTESFSTALAGMMAHPSAAMLQQAHALLHAPTIFGVEIGFNLPAFIIALLITAILVIGIQESAKFNAGIVIMKLAVVLFVIGLGSHYVNRANWGTDWHSFAPFGVGGIGLAAGLVFFSYIGFDAVSTTAQEAINPQRDMPIGIIVSLSICTLLYIGIAAVLTGMVPVAEHQYRGSAGARVSGLQGGLGGRHRHYRFHRGPYLRHAGDASGAVARAVCHGERRPAATPVFRRYSSPLSHTVEGNDPCRLSGRDRWFGDPHR